MICDIEGCEKPAEFMLASGNQLCEEHHFAALEDGFRLVPAGNGGLLLEESEEESSV